jgi:hypothetical protein
VSDGVTESTLAEIDRLRDAIRRALDEFPVPAEGLPMPLVIAHQIRVAALVGAKP